jgi:hypothetical protein
VRDAGLTAIGVRAIAESPHLGRLIALDLGHSHLERDRNAGGDGLGVLLDPAVMPNLVSCGVPGGLSDGLRKRLQTARPGLRLA